MSTSGDMFRQQDTSDNLPNSSGRQQPRRWEFTAQGRMGFGIREENITTNMHHSQGEDAYDREQVWQERYSQQADPYDHQQRWPPQDDYRHLQQPFPAHLEASTSSHPQAYGQRQDVPGYPHPQADPYDRQQRWAPPSDYGQQQQQYHSSTYPDASTSSPPQPYGQLQDVPGYPHPQADPYDRQQRWAPPSDYGQQQQQYHSSTYPDASTSSHPQANQREPQQLRQQQASYEWSVRETASALQ